MKGSPAKLLGKLGPKQNKFERTPSGTGGVTALDVAHALGLVGGQVLPVFMRVKFAGDTAAIYVLVDALTALFSDRARRRRWAIRKPDMIKRMVVMALREREAIRPRRVLTSVDCAYECGAEKCRGCKGVGRRYSQRQGKDITCERCGGSGERRWSDAERASNCGLHHSTWPDLWELRYEGMLDTLRAMEGKALRLIRAYTADSIQEMYDILHGD